MLDVTVFSSAGCGKCVATKYGLKKRGVEVHEVRVDEVPGAEEALRRSGLTHLPVVMAYRNDDDEVPDIWQDFQADFIEALLDQNVPIPELFSDAL